MFTEVGYQSRQLTSYHPASTNATNPASCDVWAYCAEPNAQANAYEALLESFYDKDWFLGVNWWMWRSDPTSGGTSDDGFTPHGKPAQEVISQGFWSKLTL